MATLAKERPDALITLDDALTLAHHRRIVAFLTEHRLGMSAGVKTFVEAGALITYWPSLPDLYRRGATHVEKILKGANPTELPVEQATTFELVMNLKTAQAFEITIPPSLLF